MPSGQWRWILVDPVPGGAGTWTFEVNPNDYTGPTRKKNITFSSCAGPDGNLLLAEGREQPVTIQFSGTLLTNTQWYELFAWMNVSHPVYLTTDLNEQLTIYITGLQFKRQARTGSNQRYPWRHDFTVDAYLIQ